MADGPAAPRRRLQLTLTLHADDHAALVHCLQDLADRADRGEILVTNGNGVSGGWDSGYTYTLTIDPDMDGDKYREQLTAWKEAKDAAVPG